VKNLRQSLKGDVRMLPFRQPRQFAPRPNFRRVDIFHLHFIDAMGRDLEQTRKLIQELKSAGTKIVWTAHDLTPHSKRLEHFDPIFQLWADAADGVIHHSQWGEQRMRDRYHFNSSTQHTVIVNRFRREHSNLNLLNKRSSIESEWGLAPTSIRIGLLGNPRAERKVRDFLVGVTLSTADDIQIVCWSLRDNEEVPSDERIAIAEPYVFANDHLHVKRLAICDLIALPYDPEGEMLTTGFVADAIAMGLGILASDWEFIIETAGDAAISCGHIPERIAECLNRLTSADVAKARAASLKLRAILSWQNAREPLLRFYQSVLDATPQ
jgi:hypothetical protein